MKEQNRLQRISKEILRKVSIILQRKVKDPRISVVTVSHVRTSKDLSHAKIFVTFLKDYSTLEKSNKIQALNKASKFIRYILCKSINLRIVPELIFLYDENLYNSRYLINLIEFAKKYDENKSKIY